MKISKLEIFGLIFIGVCIGILILSGGVAITYSKTIDYNQKVLDKTFNLATSLACLDACLNYDNNCSYCYDYWDNRLKESKEE